MEDKNTNKFYESSLQLNNNRAKKILGWKAKLNLDDTIDFVVEWYKNFSSNKKNTYIV